MNLFRKAMAITLAAVMAVIALPTATYAVMVPDDNATSTDIAVTDQDGDGVIRVACVGDSITAGTNDTNYPKHLQEYLNVLGGQNGNTYEVKNHGKGGAACRHILEDLDGDGTPEAYFYYDDVAYTSSLTYTPDVVIVQMGTNDALFGNWDNWNNYFNNDYYEYLVKPYQQKGATVILSTPPYACNGMHDGNVNGPVHDREVALANDLGLKIVDTNRLMYGMDEAFADGLHCNFTGYSRMAMNFYHYIFGGEYIEATFQAQPNTRVNVVNKANNRSYVCVTDENGKASLPFLPGNYEFSLSAECAGYKKVTDTLSLNGTSATFALTQVEGGYNIAGEGTGIQCDSATYGGTKNADSLNDTLRDSGGYQPATWKEGDWCGIELDKAYTVNMVVLYWETAAFISTYQNKGYNVYFKIGGEWVLQSLTDVSRAAYSGDIVTDTITLATAMSIEGVKVEFLNGTCSHQYAPKVYEMEILTDVKDEVPGLTPTPEPTPRPTFDPSVLEGTNVALDGTGIQCDSATYGGTLNAINLNDAATTSGGYQPATWKEGDWCGIELAEAASVNCVALYWETGTYISMYQEKGYNVYFKVDGRWVKQSLTDVVRTSHTGDIVVDILTLNPAVSIEGVKVEFLSGNITDHKYAPKLYELEVYSSSVAPTLMGDTDLSGTVSAADLTVLARHVGNIETLTSAVAKANANLDENGSVTAEDLTVLARVVARITKLAK